MLSDVCLDVRMSVSSGQEAIMSRAFIDWGKIRGKRGKFVLATVFNGF